jgi:hypothetical protein
VPVRTLCVRVKQIIFYRDASSHSRTLVRSPDGSDGQKNDRDASVYTIFSLIGSSITSLLFYPLSPSAADQQEIAYHLMQIGDGTVSPLHVPSYQCICDTCTLLILAKNAIRQRQARYSRDLLQVWCEHMIDAPGLMIPRPIKNLA